MKKKKKKKVAAAAVVMQGRHEPVVGKDLELFVRAFAARDPGPILEAAAEHPEFLRFLPGVPPGSDDVG